MVQCLLAYRCRAIRKSAGIWALTFININMVRRNIIPRRLIGAHRVRLFDIEGITYPDSVLKEAPPKDYATEAPEWGICTNDAVLILGCQSSSARDLLDKYEVRKVKVKRRSLPPTWFWDKNQVEAVAAARHESISEMPPIYMGAQEACDYLRISRSTLNRYVRHGLLEVHPVHFRSAHHSCVKHLFLRVDIERFRQHLHAVRVKNRL